MRLRRIRRAFEESKIGLAARGMPRHLRALGHFVDAQAHAIKHLCERQAALAHHFRQRLRVRTVWALPFRRDGAGCGIECDQHSLLGLDQCKTAGKRLARACERIGACGIEHHDRLLQTERGKRTRIVGNAHSLDGDIRIACDLCINRYKIILALELQAIAAEINEGDSFGPRALRLLEKVAHRAAQRILIKVACADDVKAGRLQRLRAIHEAGRIDDHEVAAEVDIGALPREHHEPAVTHLACAHELDGRAQARGLVDRRAGQVRQRAVVQLRVGAIGVGGVEVQAVDAVLLPPPSP